MNSYLKFVQDLEANLAAAKELRVSGETPVQRSASKVLLFSPHPDDECVVGLLPLRLMRELGKEVINVPVTFGSNEERQAGRASELRDACAYLGWDIHQGREDYRALAVSDVVSILKTLDPEIIFFPHQQDWNSRHIETHRLLIQALKEMPAEFSCTVVETEFWGAMDDPNLMIEGDATTVSDLMAATSLHVGEVARNPYHLLLPSWMQDNVRRGSELVQGQGGTAPDFSFATLYRLRTWKKGALTDYLEQGTTVPMGSEHLTKLFSWK